MNETHNGNLNRSKVASTGTDGQKSTGKSNDCEATLRKGSLPKAEAVRTVDRNANKGACVKAAQKQNTSDEKSYPKGRNVIPNKSDESVLTHDLGGE